MEVYLDNSSTTKCLESVKDIMVQVMMEDYGNPSSMHAKGVQAENYIKQAKEIIANTLKVQEKELYFTSGGTESNNLAIIGAAFANQRKGKHIITTGIEHPSVKNPVHQLEQQGFRVSYLPVNHQGVIDLEALEREICEETTLVSIMHVNNEIGAVQPLEKIAERIKGKYPYVYFHTDSIQGFGKYRIYPKRIGVDMMSISGHKIHGPKGIGILYANERVKLHPILFGGGQQRDMRSGTENMPGIAGIGKAIEEVYTDFDAKAERMYEIRNAFVNKIQTLEDVIINGDTGNTSAPHVVSVSFLNVRSEVLLHSLEERGIYVSAGSACASNKHAVSDTLQAIGLSKQWMEGTIRFSFSFATTMEEVEYCFEALRQLLPILRKYRRQ